MTMHTCIHTCQYKTHAYMHITAPITLCSNITKVNSKYGTTFLKYVLEDIIINVIYKFVYTCDAFDIYSTISLYVQPVVGLHTHILRFEIAGWGIGGSRTSGLPVLN